MDITLKEEQDKIMGESKQMVEDIMNKCNVPFKCSSNCALYSNVGQKDCPSEQICCLES